MALPIIPLAIVAGVVALVRNIHVSPVVQSVEDSLDMVTEGISGHRDPMGRQINGSYRWVRTVRYGKTGKGMEIDISALGRIRFKKVTG
jgi:hypothetical protein